MAYFESLTLHVEVKWSCDWLKDADIKQFCLNMNLREPLCPRDAFKGGRTNAFRLFCEIEPGNKIVQ